MQSTLRFSLVRFALLGVAMALLAACTPDTPDRDAPPEPQAAPQQTGLRDAIRQPIDRAKDADAKVQEAADAQRKAIEDAGG